MTKQLSERIVPIKSVDGELFYIYFDGKTHYDEVKGKQVEKPNRVYLDSDFNKFIINLNIDSIERYESKYASEGIKVKIGSCTPETENVDGEYVPNMSKKTLALWQITKPEEKNKYRTLLLKQDADRLFNKVSSENINNNKKIPRQHLRCYRYYL